MTDEQRYSILFRGDIVMGTTLVDVKQNMQALFKVDNERIDQLFTGKATIIKRNLALEEAQRYQQLLKRAGALVSLERENSEQPDQVVGQETGQEVDQEASKKSKQTKLESDFQSQPEYENQSDNTVSKKSEVEEPNSDSSQQWQLAPVGSDLIDKKQRQVTPAATVNTDHLAVLPQEGHLLKDHERPAAPRPAVDVEVLDWELTPYGEALLKETEKQKTAAVKIDLSDLSLAEAGGDLLKESEKNKVKTIEVNTDNLQLLPDDKP